MGFLGMVPLLVLPAVVVAVGEGGVVVGMRMPGGSMLVVVAEPPGVVVADMPMVVAMLSRGVGVLRFLPLAFGPLFDFGHGGVSFRIHGYVNNPRMACAMRVPTWWICERFRHWNERPFDVIFIGKQAV
jgi:hypothetical protein